MMKRKKISIISGGFFFHCFFFLGNVLSECVLQEKKMWCTLVKDWLFAILDCKPNALKTGNVFVLLFLSFCDL